MSKKPKKPNDLHQTTSFEEMFSIFPFTSEYEKFMYVDTRASLVEEHKKYLNTNVPG